MPQTSYNRVNKTLPLQARIHEKQRRILSCIDNQLKSKFIREAIEEKAKNNRMVGLLFERRYKEPLTEEKTSIVALPSNIMQLIEEQRGKLTIDEFLEKKLSL